MFHCARWRATRHTARWQQSLSPSLTPAQEGTECTVQWRSVGLGMIFSLVQRDITVLLQHTGCTNSMHRTLQKGHSDEDSISRGQLTIPLSFPQQPLQCTTAHLHRHFVLLFLRCFQHFSKRKTNWMKWKKQTKLKYALRTLTPNEPIKLYMEKQSNW